MVFIVPQWFNPRNGTWTEVGSGKLVASEIGVIKLPEQPEGIDWGLKLIYQEQDSKKASK
jgi:hypothetical protein